MEEVVSTNVENTVETAPVVESVEAPKADVVETSAKVESKGEKKTIKSFADLKQVADSALKDKSEVTTDAPKEQKAPVVEAAKEEWKPSYKVKVYGKEVEIPEDYREYINKDNEEKMKTLFAKALAVDEMSVKNKSYVENYEKLNSTHTALNKAIARVETYIKNDDFDSLLNTLKIPEARLQKWMYEKLMLGELPPDQQDVYNKKSEYQKQLYEKDQELEFYRSQMEAVKESQEQAELQQSFSKLDQTLSRPDVASVVQSFDARFGADAFKKEVIQRAAYMEEKLGRSLTVEEAVNEFKNFVAVSAPTYAAPTTTTQVVPPKATVAPTIPTINGKATSPVAKQVKSIDDLYKIKKQIIASESPYNK